MSSNEQLENDTFTFEINSSLDYKIKLKSERIEMLDENRKFDFEDSGKLVFWSSEPYLSPSHYLVHDIKYHFESDIDDVKSEEISRTFNCDNMVLKYTRAISPLDSLSAIFINF